MEFPIELPFQFLKGLESETVTVRLVGFTSTFPLEKSL
jgi:hypothetical protein